MDENEEIAKKFAIGNLVLVFEQPDSDEKEIFLLVKDFETLHHRDMANTFIVKAINLSDNNLAPRDYIFYFPSKQLQFIFK